MTVPQTRTMGVILAYMLGLAVTVPNSHHNKIQNISQHDQVQ